MHLAAALGLGSSAAVAFVGAGGKKTAMGQLTVEGTDERYDVGYTTTTAMPPPSDLPLTLIDPDAWRADLEAHDPPIAVAREEVPDPARVDRKVRGLEASIVEQLSSVGLFDWLLIKADGARKREFKAPGDGEPVVPSTASHVVPVASVTAVGEPLTTDVVHRPERVADITDINVGETITPDAVGTVLTHPDGGLRNAPAGASVIPLINKADTEPQQRTARDVLTYSLSQTKRCSQGVITSFTSDICEVVSAADLQEEESDG
ncbi:putative selenium-dependent hydroxylase accessory protein YqeC [Haloarcula sp. Atlit-47R]|uniref:selenium cofactor biosynthesis protein YqeC n=1 Tax=Haloarcula sp. Atlit-47R TaxID=2282132 RepID=UPI000EF1A816|nr:selenium cofactor biosynthesis protein YqeC [Haloarcula sp. Atlit-47R]RLM43904.1 putative selenium-dependent hydroxylase accessory protein YqeC [Haloarcula sp. Atlit-47R]